jgi:hypothetical protein
MMLRRRVTSRTFRDGGYRFIAPVDSGAGAGPSPGPANAGPPSPTGRGLENGRAGAGADGPEVRATRKPALPTQWALRPAAVLVVLVLGLAVGWLIWNRPRPLPELKQRRLTTNSPEVPVLRGAISPDGKYVAYTDSGGLHLKVLESGGADPAAPP